MTFYTVNKDLCHHQLCVNIDLVEESEDDTLKIVAIGVVIAAATLVIIIKKYFKPKDDKPQHNKTLIRKTFIMDSKATTQKTGAAVCVQHGTRVARV